MKLSGEQRIWITAAGFIEAFYPLVLYILMPSLCMGIGYIIFHGDMSRKDFFAYGSNFYTALGMAISLYLLGIRSRKRGESFCKDATLFTEGFKPQRAAAFLLFGTLTSGCISALLSIIASAIPSYRNSSAAMLEGPDIFFTVICVAFIAPLLEEIVFRGYMLNTMLRRFGEKKAVYISSAAFALCHVNPAWIVYAFAVGMLLTLLSIKEDNILSGIFLHIGFNLTAVCMAVVYRINPEMREAGKNPVFLAVLIVFCVSGIALLLSAYFKPKLFKNLFRRDGE